MKIDGQNDQRSGNTVLRRALVAVSKGGGVFYFTLMVCLFTTFFRDYYVFILTYSSAIIDDSQMSRAPVTV